MKGGRQWPKKHSKQESGMIGCGLRLVCFCFYFLVGHAFGAPTSRLLMQDYDEEAHHLAVSAGWFFTWILFTSRAGMPALRYINNVIRESGDTSPRLEN